MQHQPESEIMKNLGGVLRVPEAGRGLSIFVLDSYELLVEKYSEEYARGVWNFPNVKTTEQRGPIDFLPRSGTEITDEVQLKKCAVGPFRRWKL